MSTLIVIAKEPVPGRVKTRLCPPCTPDQAAALAEAALRDSLRAAAGSGADHLLLVLDGRPGPWLPPGFDVVPQAAGTLDLRLAAAFGRAARRDPGPALLIGMDTPQAEAAMLAAALARMAGPEQPDRADAVFGPAEDGGFWALGLREPGDPGVDGLLRGVPMSRSDTGRLQHERLVRAGLRISALPALRDVDTAPDAAAVAALAPHSAFARCWRAMQAVETDDSVEAAAETQAAAETVPETMPETGGGPGSGSGGAGGGGSGSAQATLAPPRPAPTRTAPARTAVPAHLAPTTLTVQHTQYTQHAHQAKSAAPHWSGPVSSSYENALWQTMTGTAEPVILRDDSGAVVRLDVALYAAAANAVDRAVLDHCTGPTLDIGCGPGRLAAELARRGVPALGVDVTPVALLLARAAGATVLGRSVFDRLPGEGRWPHALLIDGNIGIGGDPAALLRRVKALMKPSGAELIVETAPHEVDERLLLRLDGHGQPIPWARLGLSALRAVAQTAGFTVDRHWDTGDRRFAVLTT